jgi:hypothetical protein
MEDRGSKQEQQAPNKRSSTVNDNDSKRGRSFSPRRHSTAVPNNKNHTEPLQSSRNIRSQSPRAGRTSTANVEPASPRRSNRQSTNNDHDKPVPPQVPMTPPTKARSFFGLVSKSPKTNRFLKELMRDTRVDAEPYRRRKSINHPTANDETSNETDPREHSPKGRRSSTRDGPIKRSKSLSGTPASDTTTSPTSSSKFPMPFRFSMSRRSNSEKQLDTSYSFSTEQEMEAINSPKPLRRGRRPKQ